MGRMTKQGIDYFSMDVQFDDKTELYLLEKESDGLSVLVTLWQLIYQNEGYYAHDGKDLYLLIKKRINVDINEINDCINTMLERGLLNKSLHKKYKILTSRGIQKRYFDAAKRKKEVRAVKDFLLIDINAYENIIDVNINSENANINATKEKEEVKEEVKEEEDIKGTWNFFAEQYELSKIQKLTPTRKRHIKARLKENDFELITILREAEKQPFLLGKNKEGWSIDFDWIFSSPNNYVKILENKYKDKQNEGVTISELTAITQKHFASNG
jgi:hypothetical protein